MFAMTISWIAKIASRSECISFVLHKICLKMFFVPIKRASLRTKRSAVKQSVLEIASLCSQWRLHALRKSLRIRSSNFTLLSVRAESRTGFWKESVYVSTPLGMTDSAQHYIHCSNFSLLSVWAEKSCKLLLFVLPSHAALKTWKSFGAYGRWAGPKRHCCPCRRPRLQVCMYIKIVCKWLY
jgi:hypothetical protein